MVFWDLNTIRGLSFQQIVYWKINLLFVRAYEIVCMEKKVRCESFPLMRLKIWISSKTQMLNMSTMNTVYNYVSGRVDECHPVSSKLEN